MNQKATPVPETTTDRPYAQRCVTCIHDHPQNDLVGDCQVFHKDIYHHSVEACPRYERNNHAA
jgi:hypothetical protein